MDKFTLIVGFKNVWWEYDDTTTTQASVSETESAHTSNTSVK